MQKNRRTAFLFRADSRTWLEPQCAGAPGRKRLIQKKGYFDYQPACYYKTGNGYCINDLGVIIPKNEHAATKVLIRPIFRQGL